MDSRYIAWRERDIVGSPVLDEQHRTLVSLMNALHLLREQNPDAWLMGEASRLLLLFATVHFETEEAFLEKADFAGLKEHEDRHLEALDALKRICAAYAEQQDAEALFPLLRSWWADHINHQDKQYIPALEAEAAHASRAVPDA